MTLIERINIHAFKSIQEASLELGAFNVFVGANGSGKSNILEAIGVLGAAASGRVDDESLLRRGVRPGLPDLYKSAFPQDIPDGIDFSAATGQSSYAVSLNDASPSQGSWIYQVEKWRVDANLIVNREPNGLKPLRLDQQRGLAALRAVEVSPLCEGAELLNHLQDYAIYTPNTATLRGLLADLQIRHPIGLSGGRLAEAIREMQHQAMTNDHLEQVLEDVQELIDWSTEIGSIQGEVLPLSAAVPRTGEVLLFQDRYMGEGHNLISAYDASEGALYVLFAAILAAHPDSPRLLAIDNFDAALNPRLVRSLTAKMVDWTLASGRQLLLTCHNPQVLDGLLLQDERVRLFAVDRTFGGKTVIHRVIVDDALLKKAKEGWPLSRLWVSGHLGGVPSV